MTFLVFITVFCWTVLALAVAGVIQRAMVADWDAVFWIMSAASWCLGWWHQTRKIIRYNARLKLLDNDHRNN